MDITEATKNAPRRRPGRPKGSIKTNNKRPITVRLSRLAVEFLRDHSGPGTSQADLIEKALAGWYGTDTKPKVSPKLEKQPGKTNKNNTL